MHKLRLVPLGSESVEERVAAFRQYNDEVRNEVYASFKRNMLGSNCSGLHHPLGSPPCSWWGGLRVSMTPRAMSVGAVFSW